MNSNRKYLIGLCVATLSLGALAQNADEHKDHHPAGTKPVATAVQKPSSGPVGADKMVAVDLGLSYHTVDSHIRRIYEKLHVRSSTEAVSKALNNRIV